MAAFAGLLALVVAAVFTGAALYVLVCEQPARLGLDDRALLLEFKPSYKHGAALQAPMSLVAFALGLVAWWHLQDWRWLGGAIAILAPWPWTLLVIRPVNNELLATAPHDAGPQTRRLIVRWGRLHVGRLTFGALATALFLWVNAGLR